MTDPNPDAERQQRMLLDHAISKRDWEGVARIAASLARSDGNLPDIIFETQEELLAPIPSIDWFCKDFDLSPGRPGKIVGVGGGGKSIAMQSAVITTITGQPMWGAFPTKQGQVAHIDYEMGSFANHVRYRALAHGHGVLWPDVVPHLKLASLPKVYMNDEHFFDCLTRAIDGCTLCIIDSLRRGCPGEDENSSMITQYIDVVSRASDATRCTVLLAHHSSSKVDGSQQRPHQAAGRGSSAIHDAGGSELLFTGGTDGKDIKVKQTRAFLGGKKHDDFYLVIEDVDGGKDAGGGMRVLAKGVSETDAMRAQAVLAQQAIDDNLILQAVMAKPGISKGHLATASGVKGKALSDSIERLIARERLSVTITNPYPNTTCFSYRAR